MENRDSAFVLQQRHIHQTFQGFERSVFCSVLHNIERLSASQELDAGQFRGCGGVEQVEDDLSLLGGIVRIQGPVVFFASRRAGKECGFQRFKACHGNTSPPATCALQIARLTLRERAGRRTAKQTRRSTIVFCRENTTCIVELNG